MRRELGAEGGEESTKALPALQFMLAESLVIPTVDFATEPSLVGAEKDDMLAF